MSAAVSRLLSLLHGGPQVIRNGLGFPLTVIAKKLSLGTFCWVFMIFMALLAITALLPRLRLLSLPWRPGCHRRCHPRTRVEKAPAAGPWLAQFIWTLFLYLHRFTKYKVLTKLSYNSDWEEKVTGHEIVDAIECLALRFCGAFAWRLKYCTTVVRLWSWRRSTSSLPSFSFFFFLE